MMGIRKGFLLGFLFGAVAGSISKPSAAEAPALDVESSSSGSPAVNRLKEQAAEVMEEAKKAAREREEEMQREFEEMRRYRRPY